MQIVYFHPDINSFVASFEDKVADRIASSIRLLSEEEYHLSMPHSKKVEKNIFELRIFSPENIRIFYTFHEGRIVLLHAIHKKEQQIRPRDLDTARRRLKILHS